MTNSKTLRADMLDHLANQAMAKIIRRQDALESAPSDWVLFVERTIREAVYAAAGEKYVAAGEKYVAAREKPARTED